MNVKDDAGGVLSAELENACTDHIIHYSPVLTTSSQTSLFPIKRTIVQRAVLATFKSQTIVLMFSYCTDTVRSHLMFVPHKKHI